MAGALLSLPPISSTESRSDLQNHRHNQRPAAGTLLDVALQIVADLLLDHAIVGLFLVARTIQRPLHNLPRLGDHLVIVDRHAADHDLRRVLHLAAPPSHHDHRQPYTVSTPMISVL